MSFVHITQRHKTVSCLVIRCEGSLRIFRVGTKGWTGKQSDLSGQHKFTSGGKYLLIVGGEEDKCAAFQMLRDYQESKGNDDFNPVAVVSPTTGESCADQVAAQYEFIDSFDVVILGLDNDEAGQEAMRVAAEKLPQDKLRIVKWSDNDPNNMLLEGRERQFLRDFYGAKDYTDTGVKSSDGLMDEVRDFLKIKKLTLPDYMHKLQENMRGGIAFCRVVNVIADTSVGKSSHINNKVYHWIMNTDSTVGVISLEATAAEYAMEMLSIHLEHNLNWYKSGDDVLEYLDNPEVQKQYEELFTLPDGRPRFYIVDEREGKISTVEKQIQRMHKQYGVDVVVIDVLSDLLRSLDNSEQDKHMMFQKLFVKNGPIIVNALHTRKPPNDKDGKKRKATEYDALGSSSFVQSAHINIVYNRDKMAQDIIEKNTTHVDMP